jgi:hypothetical protein
VQVIVQHPRQNGKTAQPYTMRSMRNNELPDCYFPEAVKMAQQAGAARLVIPKGSYNFRHPASGSLVCPNGGPTIGAGAAHLTLLNLHDMEIDFSGSTLNFNRPGYGVQVKVSERLIVKGFFLDWPQLLIASHGRIAPPAAHEINKRLIIDPQHHVGPETTLQAVNVWDDRGSTWSLSQSGTEVYFMNANCGVSPDGVHGQNNCYRYEGGQIYSSKFFNPFPLGSSVLVRHYVYSGFAFDINSSNDIDVEDVHVLAGPGMGFVVDNDAPERLVRGFRFLRCSVGRAPGRLIGMASDAFHVSAIQGDTIIEDSDFGYNGDDTVNITGQVYPVTGEGSTVGVPRGLYANKGDVLAFFRADAKTSLTTDFLATARVVAVAEWGTNVKVTLDRALAVAKSLRAANLTRRSSVRYYIESSRFHNNRGNGLVLRSIHGFVDRNQTNANLGSGIALFSGSNEGPSTHDVVVSNNIVTNLGGRGAGLGAITSYIHSALTGHFVPTPVNSHLLLQNNTVKNVPGPAFVIASSAAVRMMNNVAISANMHFDPDGHPYGTANPKTPVIIYGSRDVQICNQTGPVSVDRGGSTQDIRIGGAGCVSH